jgi:hypothetical protein
MAGQGSFQGMAMNGYSGHAMGPMGLMGPTGGTCGPAQAMGKGGNVVAMGFGQQNMGSQGSGPPVMGSMAQHFGHQAMGCMGSQSGCGQQAMGSQGAPGFGAQAMGSMGSMGGMGGMGNMGSMGNMGGMGNMGNMPLGGFNGHLPFKIMMAGPKPGRQQQQPGKRPATGFGGHGGQGGKRRFATQCNCYGQIPIPLKMEVLQSVLPEVWNPVTSASKTSVDMDSAMAIGFDRWPGSPLETRLVIGLA